MEQVERVQHYLAPCNKIPFLLVEPLPSPPLPLLPTPVDGVAYTRSRAYTHSSQTRLGYVSRVNTCVYICTRGVLASLSLPLLCPRFSPRFVCLNSLNLPLEPVPFFFPLFSLSLCLSLFACRFQTADRIEITFWRSKRRFRFRDRSCAVEFEFHGVVFVCIRGCRASFFLFFFWSNRWKKIRLTWLITAETFLDTKRFAREKSRFLRFA